MVCSECRRTAPKVQNKAQSKQHRLAWPITFLGSERADMGGSGQGLSFLEEIGESRFRKAKKNKKKAQKTLRGLASGHKTTTMKSPLAGGAGGFAMVLVLRRFMCGFAKVLLWSANVQGSRHW